MKDRAECKEWGRTFAQDPGRMKDAQNYSTVLAELWVKSTAEPWKQFETCMVPRGYAVTLN